MLLTPYRVLDLTGPLGFLAGKVLADLGADVVKVEPPEGDPSRRWPPHLSGDNGGAPAGFFWLAANAGKRSLILDLDATEGRRLLVRLAEKVDFLLESFSPGTLDAWGLTDDVLQRTSPGLITVSITPFGQTGPYRDYAAFDLEIMALGGAMSLAGEEAGEPMRVSVPQAPMWVGVEAAMGALTALAHRAVTGRGQRVDVSAQAAVVSALAHAPAFWDLAGVSPQRAGIYVTGRTVTGARMRAFWRCRDGWINFIIYGGAAGRHTNRELVFWMQERGMAPAWLATTDWAQFEVTTLTQDEVDKLEAPIEAFLATLTKREFMEGAIRRGMLGYPVATVSDIAEDTQLAARDFWQELDDPGSGRPLRYPGGFARVNGARLPLRRPAPKPGQHSREVMYEWLEPQAPASRPAATS
jgi:crotonobetainyl-CoA:carnitine CoA-transferase CaiB-like acyl-CoA transferase